MTTISTSATPVATNGAKSARPPTQPDTPVLAVDEFILHSSKRHPVTWVVLAAATLASLLVSPWLVLPLAWLAVVQLAYSFSVTSHQIVEHRGVLWRRTSRIPLNDLASIDLINRNFGLLFQVGKLTVTTQQGKTESFSWVNQPERLIRLLDRQRG